ncbi:MAG: hypothetical protein RSD32_06325 [Oscillospiraceae bacterium]
MIMLMHWTGRISHLSWRVCQCEHWLALKEPFLFCERETVFWNSKEEKLKVKG